MTRACTEVRPSGIRYVAIITVIVNTRRPHCLYSMTPGNPITAKIFSNDSLPQFTSNNPTSPPKHFTFLLSTSSLPVSPVSVNRSPRPVTSHQSPTPLARYATQVRRLTPCPSSPSSPHNPCLPCRAERGPSARMGPSSTHDWFPWNDKRTVLVGLVGSLSVYYGKGA